MKTPRLPPLPRLLATLWLATACTTAAAQSPAQPFDIWEYEVEGNSVLDIPRIERALQAHLGPGRAMADIEAARAALEQAYQAAGYLTVGVDIPEQDISGGVVRLQVIEGRVANLWVSGSRWHDQGRIRATVAEFSPGQVPEFNRAQQQLAQVNAEPGQRVQPVLRPGRLPGTVDIDLQVNDELPLSGTLELNNQHASGTARERLQAGLRYANLFQLGHALSINLVTAPAAPRQSTAWITQYQVPLAAGGSLSLGWTHSSSDLETLGGTQVLGRGDTWTLRRGWALHTADLAATLSLGADLKQLDETTRFGSDAVATPLRYAPLQVSGSLAWSGEHARWQLQSGLTLNPRTVLQRRVPCPIADGSDGHDDQFACKRQGGDGGFGVWRVDARGLLPLAPLALHLRASGQAATGALVSAEQFTLGGADSVRGHAESSASGDHGWLTSAELHSPNLARLIHEGWQEVTALGFADLGRVMTDDAAAGQARRRALAGVGLGLRARAASLETSIDLAWPVSPIRRPRLGDDPRLHARLQLRF